MIREHLLKLRQMILKASSSLSDDDAYDVPELFPTWKAGTLYEVKDGVKPRIQYAGKLYRCEQTHTSQADWTPDIVPALWTAVPKPGEILVWRQPTGAQDAYNIGDKVHYPDAESLIYICTSDYNIYAPDVYGWEVWVP